MNRFKKLLQKTQELDVTKFMKVLQLPAIKFWVIMTGNHFPFMNESLPTAIMVGTKVRNIFLKNRSEENKLF